MVNEDPEDAGMRTSGGLRDRAFCMTAEGTGTAEAVNDAPKALKSPFMCTAGARTRTPPWLFWRPRYRQRMTYVIPMDFMGMDIGGQFWDYIDAPSTCGSQDQT
jgi:hypothetical protein